MVTPLPHTFHEGIIEDFQLGPRRELILTISVALLPPGRTAGRMEWYDFRVRFGGITNFEEVRSFFSPGVKREEVSCLAYDKDELSRPNRLIFRLEMMGDYDPLIIRCGNVTVWQDSQEVSLQDS